MKKTKKKMKKADSEGYLVSLVVEKRQMYKAHTAMCGTPTHDRAKAGRPARTYIQQLCEDTGCCPEDLPEAMNDREKWREGSGISVLPARHDDDDDDKAHSENQIPWQWSSNSLQAMASHDIPKNANENKYLPFK